MKRKKLVLHRETLRALDSSMLRHAAGRGFTVPPECTTFIAGDCGSDDTIGTSVMFCPTYGYCSNACGTGGPC